jgi:hypothetical protein
MIQFVPALLALHWLIIITLIILTLFFGRIYCSSVCPLGVYQDFISRLRKTFSSKKHRKKYKYRKALTLLRWTFAGISLLSFISGFSFRPIQHFQPVHYSHPETGLSGRKQPAGRNFQSLRQPHFLSDGCLCDECFIPDYCPHNHIDSEHHGLEKRQDLLQYRLSCWHNPGCFQPVFSFSDPIRQRKM